MLKRFSRSNDAGDKNELNSDQYHWDFAIPWGRGRHVTLFPAGIATVVAALMLVALALVAAISFL